MAKSTKNVVRKKRGRPATGQDPVTAIRLSKELRKNVDGWATKQTDKPGRSESIRRLVEIGLTVTPSRKSSDDQKARAKVMAANAIDRLTDTTATDDDKAARKRRLIKGPEEFREARVDRLKTKTK